MNWDFFQTHNDAPDKAFETLCDQLFINWCTSEYKEQLLSSMIVNGSGGDGGVESYAILKNEEIVGMQAKWFRTSMQKNQINQIKNSINTALKIRPNIVKYIVCIPRDLSSVTGKGNNSEESRWNDLVADMKLKYKKLNIELWTNTKLLVELQKPESAGIYKYWFSKSELSIETIKYSFEKSKESWLKTKYVPDLNTYGKIYSNIMKSIGNYEDKIKIIKIINIGIKRCKKCIDEINQYIDLIKNKDIELVEKINNEVNKIKLISETCEKLFNYMNVEPVKKEIIDYNIFDLDFSAIIDMIKDSKFYHMYNLHLYDVEKALKKLSEVEFFEIVNHYNSSVINRPILFLGEPGTGKTHGIAALSETLFNNNLHLPILVQARNIPENYNWGNIIISTLGLPMDFSEEELWQALTAMVNRNKFQQINTAAKIDIIPKVIIIVDALDEKYPNTRWKERIQESIIISEKYSQIHFVFTSRPNAFSEKIKNIETIRIGSTGDAPMYELFDKYIEANHIIVENPGWLKSILKTPLTLKLFCEINKGKTIKNDCKIEVSITDLIKRKINNIEEEFCEKEQLSVKNQYVYKSILFLSNEFLVESQIERNCLKNKLLKELNISSEQTEKIILYLENYGILSSYIEQGKCFDPDKYFLYPGIQGYFDYVNAIRLLKMYNHPSEIDFNKYSNIKRECIYILSILSIQEFNYLITKNFTIKNILSNYELNELQFYALRYTTNENGLQYKDRILEIMSTCADALITITNELVLPLSRIDNHPLGVSLLDDFLFSFEKPAQRDLLWSAPDYLYSSRDAKWKTSRLLELNDEFNLLNSDNFNNTPSIYAWALSNLSNDIRRKCRITLMKWAKFKPNDFFELFKKFYLVNDPQIVSDLFSILMCLVYDGANECLIKEIVDWIKDNVLDITKINSINDVSVRYYAIAILKKTIQLEIYSEHELDKYMPPYFSNDFNLSLSKEALAGTRMRGFKAIDYDLSRYVLIDYFVSKFSKHGNTDDKQIKDLIFNIAKINKGYDNITFEQLILSAAYAYILDMGWNEEEFYNYDVDEKGKDIIGGMDITIRRRHYAATHGSLSNVMTVCEKYIWQFRNYFSCFLADRIKFYNDYNFEYIKDYGLLDDFLIPIQDIEQIDPYNLPEDNPWYIPEKNSVILDNYSNDSKQVIESTIKSPDINWKKWILVDNKTGNYKINSDKLCALKSYSCFYGNAGVETCIMLNSIIIDESNMNDFITKMRKINNPNDRNVIPSDWNGGIVSSCYITPKEVCWFPWKERYDSDNKENFKGLNVLSAVEECTYNFPEYGDVHYYLPSKHIRDMLGIVNSNGYEFLNNDKMIVAEYNLVGEHWRTYQDYLLVDKKSLFTILKKENKKLIWILREYRQQSAKSREKFGEFYVTKTNNYIGYFEKNSFKTIKISEEIEN